ncbi:MAG: hypothetical protein U9R48_08305, partial [Chloroflexota bacterium]|nr:hypothetical protein [Chloroflexota bacterium]
MQYIEWIVVAALALVTAVTLTFAPPATEGETLSLATVLGTATPTARPTAIPTSTPSPTPSFTGTQRVTATSQP